VQTIHGSKKCRLLGGPGDGWSGDYVDTGQDVAYFDFGSGLPIYVYRLDVTAFKPGEQTVWRWDKKESNQRAVDFGMSATSGERGVAE
jgi:hypothetical protein